MIQIQLKSKMPTTPVTLSWSRALQCTPSPHHSNTPPFVPHLGCALALLPPVSSIAESPTSCIVSSSSHRLEWPSHPMPFPFSPASRQPSAPTPPGVSPWTTLSGHHPNLLWHRRALHWRPALPHLVDHLPPPLHQATTFFIVNCGHRPITNRLGSPFGVAASSTSFTAPSWCYLAWPPVAHTAHPA
jgi:hypothetical protein